MSDETHEPIREALKIYVDRPISRRFHDREIEEWCAESSWTEPFFQEGKWWAFPPCGAIPDIVPVVYIRRIRP